MESICLTTQTAVAGTTNEIATQEKKAEKKRNEKKP